MEMVDLWWSLGLVVGVILSSVVLKMVGVRIRSSAVTTILSHLGKFEYLIGGKVYSWRGSRMVECLDSIRGASRWGHEMRHLWITRKGNWFITSVKSEGSQITHFEVTPVGVERARELLSPYRERYVEYFGEPEEA